MTTSEGGGSIADATYPTRKATDTPSGSPGGSPAGDVGTPGPGGPVDPVNDPERRLHALQPYHGRVAYALEQNMKDFFDRIPLERCGFLTLTFEEPIDAHEASKRLHRFRTGVLSKVFPCWLGVVERSSRDRLHFHLVVECEHDIRTGFDFDAFQEAMHLARARDYGAKHKELTRKYAKGAPAALRHLWALLRRKAPAYGFGRCELLPIRRSGEAVSVYIAKYIGKHLGQKRLEDKKCKTVVARGVARKTGTKFAWNSEGARRWRAAIKSLCAECKIPSMDMLKHLYGPRWAAGLAATIMHESDRLAALEADKMQ